MNHLSEPQLNATPLIDVLLVLLIMLIFTLPIATHAVKLNLPQGPPAPLPAPTPIVQLEIMYGGDMYWNGQRLTSLEELAPKLRALAGQANAPVVKVMPERRAPYELVAQVLAAAQRARVTKLAIMPVPDL